jgi:hypothetical protein
MTKRRIENRKNFKLLDIGRMKGLVFPYPQIFFIHWPQSSIHRHAEAHSTNLINSSGDQSPPNSETQKSVFRFASPSEMHSANGDVEWSAKELFALLRYLKVAPTKLHLHYNYLDSLF